MLFHYVALELYANRGALLSHMQNISYHRKLHRKLTICATFAKPETVHDFCIPLDMKHQQYHQMTFLVDDHNLTMIGYRLPNNLLLQKVESHYPAMGWTPQEQNL